MICIPILYPKCFMLGKKASGNRSGLHSNKTQDFQPVTYLVPLYIFESNILNVD